MSKMDLSKVVRKDVVALAVGATVVVAQQVGKNRLKEANETISQALVSGLVIAITISFLLFLFRGLLIDKCYANATDLVKSNTKIYLSITLLTYPFIAIEQICNGILRGSGDTKTPMTVTVRMNIINAILGFILIIGVDLRKVRFRGLVYEKRY